MATYQLTLRSVCSLGDGRQHHSVFVASEMPDDLVKQHLIDAGLLTTDGMVLSVAAFNHIASGLKAQFTLPAQTIALRVHIEALSGMFPTAVDADRLLGLSDEFLENWKAESPNDPEYLERQAEYDVIRPLFALAPELLSVLKSVYPRLEFLPDGTFRMSAPSRNSQRWIGLASCNDGKWVSQTNEPDRQIEHETLHDCLEHLKCLSDASFSKFLDLKM